MLKTLSPILSIVLAVAIFFLFAKPIFSEIGSIQGETDEYKQAVDKAAELNSKLAGLVTERNSFSSLELERLERLVPYNIDEVRALVDLKALAESHNMLFGNIEVGSLGESGSVGSVETNSVLSEKDFETLEISFGIIGTYEQMRSFLKDIERSLVRMEVTQFGTSVTSGDLQLYTFTVQLYALKSMLGE